MNLFPYTDPPSSRNELREHLPPMPIGAVYTRAMGTVGASMYTYTADQLRAYATAAVEAEREMCADIVRNAERNGCACSDREELAQIILAQT
jgi:hypothetical protein